MFSPRKRPLLLVADRLLALRLSLNTPVVATPDLPAGPARAAIAVHNEAGRTCFTVAVRSLRNGESVLYELEGEDPNDASGIAVALDAALSFGESMGFLFDDELVTSRSEPVLRAALAQLREIIAPPGPEMGETTQRPVPVPPPEEILLEEALETEAAPAEPARAPSPAPAPAPAPAPEPAAQRARPAPAPRSVEPPPARARERRMASREPRAPAAPEPRAPAAPPAPPGASLTKFRHVAAAGDAPPAKAAPAERPPQPASPESTSQGPKTGGAMLGRVKPVRLRAPDAPAPIPALLRLLSSF